MNKYQGMMTIISKNELIKDVYEMLLEGKAASYITTPGQFINIKLNDSLQPYLRRPMSICDYDENHIKIIFRVVGTGTKILADKKIGDTLDCLTGLGNGFNETNYKDVVVIGGGLGVPPMYALTKRLIQQNVKVHVVLGFNDQSSIFYQNEFSQLAPTSIATMDGSVGIKGTVVDALKVYDFPMDAYYACGPEKMLEALALNYPNNGYLSYEARMGCGFGACMGCSCKVKSQPYKRICMEGPVLLSSEVMING
ncbi:MAG: dihydroorotate dehydrogenase electron transfer subunit [Erysipelotrichaceae bacterium]|nr:dihydroorotate dehydrogenase electron transfer subunit [Erysipelotrichaceae bacterium]